MRTATEILIPLDNRVLIRMDEIKEGLIVRPESSKEDPMTGIVVAIGPGRTFDDGSIRPCKVQVGDRVSVGKWTGQPVTVNNEKLRILFDDDILGVFGHGES